jgi:restriction endonuclease S subunit
VKIESKWEQIRIENSLTKINCDAPKIEEYNIQKKGIYPVVTQDVSIEIAGYTNKTNAITDLPIVLFGDHSCCVKYIDYPFFRGADGTVLLKPNPKFNPKYYYYLIEYVVNNLIDNTKYERHNKYLKDLFIPLPPKNIQEKIVTEIERIEEEKKVMSIKIIKLNQSIQKILNSLSGTTFRIDQILSLEYGRSLPEHKRVSGNYPVLGSNGIVGYHNEYLIVGPSVVVGRKGSAGKVVWVENNNFPIDTTFYVKLLDNSNSLRLIYYILKGLNLNGTGTGVPGLNRNDVYQKSIIMPDKEKQRKIVLEIEALEKQIVETRKIIDDGVKLKNAVLKKYL